MDNTWNYLCVYLCLLSIVPLCHSQGIYLTQPKLLSITPIGSSSLNVTWQFANSTYDLSDLIRIYIDFYEFYYNYGPINTSIDYTFTSTNKSLTSVTKTFELVNAFYYVCFSSNSTNMNTTVFLFVKTCQLKQTCLRTNSSICPQMPFVVISYTGISSNSFIINILWLNNLPYLQNTTTVQLANNGIAGTPLALTGNTTYTNRPYQFSGLQSQTNYVVNVIVSYTIFGQSMSNTMNYTVTTSRLSKLFYTRDIFIFVAWSVLLSFLFS